MRDLEAETYRRLIAWEDEKKYSISGNAPTRRDTMEAQKSFKPISPDIGASLKIWKNGYRARFGG
jgi:hypothetical protein